MEWFKKHADSVTTIATLMGALIWMNSRFNEIDQRFGNIEKDMAIIKTVLIMKDIFPKELATNSDQ